MATRLSLLLLLLILCFSADCKASSTLLVDQDFNVISFNGVSYKSSFVTSDSKIKLNPGVNKIAIEYEVVFDHDDDFDLIKSDTVLVSFYANRNQNYVLSYLKPANPRAARIFAKNPTISILDQTGKNLKASSYFLGSKSESFINQQTKPSLRGQQPINIISNKNPRSTKKRPAVHSSKPDKPMTDVAEKLEFWWSKATPKQREAFLKKILNKE